MKGWKTLAFNAGMAVLMVLEAANWVDLVGADNAAFVTMGVNVANMVLRYFTTTPMGRAE